MSSSQLTIRLKKSHVPPNRRAVIAQPLNRNTQQWRQQQQQTSGVASDPVMKSCASVKPQPPSERATSPTAVAKVARVAPPQQHSMESEQFTSAPFSEMMSNDPSSDAVPRQVNPFEVTSLSETMNKSTRGAMFPQVMAPNDPSDKLVPQSMMQPKEKQDVLKPPQQRSIDDPFEPTPLSEIMRNVSRSNMVPQVTSSALSMMQHQEQRSSISMKQQPSSSNLLKDRAQLEREEKQRKYQCTMLARVLMKYLKQKRPEMHARAKNVIRECVERNKNQDPGYSSITSSVKRRLRDLVGDFYWHKAEHYLAKMSRQKHEKQQQQQGPNGGDRSVAKVTGNQTNPYDRMLSGRIGPASNSMVIGSSSATFSGTKRRLEQSRWEDRKKQSFEKPTLPPMQKGKAMMTLTGFNALDMHYPHLNAADRTNVLYQLLSYKHHGSKMRFTSGNNSKFSGFTKKFVHDWRVQFEKKNSTKSTLWFMVSSFSDHIAAKMLNIDDGNNLKMSVEKGSSDNTDKYQEEDRKRSAPIGPLTSDVIDTLRQHFMAHVTRHQHNAMLNDIEPIDEGKVNNSTITCSICSDNFDAINTVPCSSESEIHFFCKKCFASYATVTVESGPIQCIKCPLPDCKSLFSVDDTKDSLSQWDLLMIEHREASRDRRVALAAKATLHCICGVVAIITEEDMGDGRVSCPGKDCNKRYCCKCGNDDHGKEPCPPPAKTMQWLDKHSKECPNCKNRIEKNGGCDHMTCRPSAGGCGHEFWWTCLCPYTGHKPGCNRGGRRR